MKYIVDDQGRRIYHSQPRRAPYKPVADEDRKYRVRKPDDPRAVRFGGDWFLPLEVRPEEERVMPETVADADIRSHGIKCRCVPCQRPNSKRSRHAEKIAARRAARASSATASPAPDRP